MTKTRANKPSRVVLVREEKVVNGEDAEEENDSAGEIVATMPKSLQMKHIQKCEKKPTKETGDDT